LQNGHQSAERKRQASFLRAADGFQGLSSALLILGRKSRHLVSNRRAGLDVLAVKTGNRELHKKQKRIVFSFSPIRQFSLGVGAAPD